MTTIIFACIFALIGVVCLAYIYALCRAAGRRLPRESCTEWEETANLYAEKLADKEREIKRLKQKLDDIFELRDTLREMREAVE